LNEILIQLDKLYDLNISQYCFILFLSVGRREDALRLTGISLDCINRLVDKKYITESYELLEKGQRIVTNSGIQNILTPTSSFDEFVEKYRSLFPPGSRQGYLYKGDKQGCIKKMRRFMKLYPKFTEDIILEATRTYIHKQFLSGYQYLQSAHYLIEKDGISNLAGLCEAYLLKYSSDKSSGGFELDLN
jgi:hypothetical protein